MLKEFIKYYKPYKLLFISDMLASFLISLSAMVYPIITRNMLNDFIPNSKYYLIIKFGIILLVIYIIRALLKYFVQFYGHVMGVRIQSDMRKELFGKIQRLPYSYFDNHETGAIMSNLTNDIFEISELAHHGPENVIMCTLMIILSFIYLATINLNLTLIIFASVPFLFLISMNLRKKMREASRKSKIAMSGINAGISSSISGIRVTKAFNNSELEMKKFDGYNKDFIEARKLHFKSFATFNSSTSFITDFFNVICLISGGIFLYKGLITFGDYSTFIVSINLFITPVTTLVQFSEQLEEGIAGFEKFERVMAEKEEYDSPNAKDYKDLNGDIEFKNVCFKYDSNEVLDDISFKVKKGQTVALVGESGGGKTTICHLLPRFYNIDSGSIEIDNKNISDITMNCLRRNIGIVQQDVFLFSGTFKENIAYGNLNASMDEIIEASKKANIYDYIMSLPHGFDTQIGERGVRLSGGQKQRLSIARVFLKNPPILLLDEATSALDNTTEFMIQEALDTLKEGRTTIVVAHRLSTIKNADNILVIEHGKVKESGTHEELMNIENGTYKELYVSQFRDI